MFAIVITAMAASAVIANAETPLDCKANPNADYKYSKTYNLKYIIPSEPDAEVKVETTVDIFDNSKYLSVPDKNSQFVKVYCKITFPEGFDDYRDYEVNFTGHSLQPPRTDWKYVGNVAYGAMYSQNFGTHNLHVGIYGYDGVSIPFEVIPARPTGMKIITYPDKIWFDATYVDALKCGNTSMITINGGSWLVSNSTDGGIIKGFKPNKKYDAILAGMELDSNGNIMGKSSYAYEVKNIPTGPSVKPVIKSVKISNVKVKKYFDTSSWKYRYKTTYTATVTLSKKASGTKGARIRFQGLNGLTSTTETVKGTGKTFKKTITMDAPKSFKGGKIKVSLMTYSNNKYKCYSYESKGKTVTIK